MLTKLLVLSTAVLVAGPVLAHVATSSASSAPVSAHGGGTAGVSGGGGTHSSGASLGAHGAAMSTRAGTLHPSVTHAAVGRVAVANSVSHKPHKMHHGSIFTSAREPASQRAWGCIFYNSDSTNFTADCDRPTKTSTAKHT